MRNIEKSIRIDCPAEAVFATLTSGLSLPELWPIEHAEIGAVEGESIVLRGDGFEDRGTITRYRANREFTYVYWSTNHGTTESRDTRITISYLLMEKRGQTSLTVRQSNLPSDEMWDRMQAVWPLLLQSLKSNVEETSPSGG